MPRQSLRIGDSGLVTDLPPITNKAAARARTAANFYASMS